MKIWKLTRSKVEDSTLSTCEKMYADPLDASKEMLARYTVRCDLYRNDAIIAEYRHGVCAILVLKDGRRWTWTIDELEVA